MAAGKERKKEKLEQVISGLRERWGTQIINRATGPGQAPAHMATGFPALDASLGVGGIPRGRISELLGRPTSGMATVALRTLAQVQEQGGTAVYVDLERTFDPDYARRCGVNLSRLTLVHPYDAGRALAMLPDFIGDGAIDLLLFDMPAQRQAEPLLTRRLSSALGRLLASLSKSNSTLLFLTSLPLEQGEAAAYPQQAALPHFATVRLLLQKEQWLYRQHDVYGYEAQVLVVKNKLAAPGATARITITFEEGP